MPPWEPVSRTRRGGRGEWCVIHFWKRDNLGLCCVMSFALIELSDHQFWTAIQMLTIPQSPPATFHSHHPLIFQIYARVSMQNVEKCIGVWMTANQIPSPFNCFTSFKLSVWNVCFSEEDSFFLENISATVGDLFLWGHRKCWANLHSLSSKLKKKSFKKRISVAKDNIPPGIKDWQNWSDMGKTLIKGLLRNIELQPSRSWASGPTSSEGLTEA